MLVSEKEITPKRLAPPERLAPRHLSRLQNIIVASLYEHGHAKVAKSIHRPGKMPNKLSGGARLALPTKTMETDLAFGQRWVTKGNETRRNNGHGRGSATEMGPSCH